MGWQLLTLVTTIAVVTHSTHQLPWSYRQSSQPSQEMLQHYYDDDYSENSLDPDASQNYEPNTLEKRALTILSRLGPFRTGLFPDDSRQFKPRSFAPSRYSARERQPGPLRWG